MAVPSRPTADHAPFPFSTWLGVILLFLVFGLVVAVLVRIAPRGNTYEAKRAEAREAKLKTTMDEAHKELTTYAWVDKAKGVARIPVDRAMELTLADLAQKKPERAGPIETPAPSAAPSPAAPAASPQSSASPTKPISVSGSKSENAGQPAAASNPPNAAPGTQPGANATPAAASPAPSGQPPASPSATPPQGSATSPLPVAGKTPPPAP
jgi:hypothetical protein